MNKPRLEGRTRPPIADVECRRYAGNDFAKGVSKVYYLAQARLYGHPEVEGKPAEDFFEALENALNLAYAQAETAELARRAMCKPHPKFRLGDYVRKISGSEWRGPIVGTYSTELTPEGYAVESHLYKGSVQIYPANALERWDRNAAEQSEVRK